jgi:2-polyprenyl-6-methoxyphenol hydroxylase-like FAD-dependent oxidoreductase
MSPVGGVGINYAIQDAVAAANLLGDRLKSGTISDSDLAMVQHRREFPTRFIQTFQAFVQKRVIASVLSSTGPLQIPLALKILFGIPVIRDLPARLIALGIRREHVRNRDDSLPATKQAPLLTDSARK